MKIAIIILPSLVWALFLPGDKIDKQELFQRYTAHRQVATGMGGGGRLFSMQAPFGRYLLFKRGEELLAVLITNHPNSHASEFRWLWFKGQERKQGSGACDEKAGPRGLTIESFKLAWSAGDWFYFSDNDLRMARSEITQGEEIQRRLVELVWYDRSDLLNSEREETSKLQKALGIEMSTEPSGAARGSQPIGPETNSTSPAAGPRH